jgi:peptide/nickel transport system substrate-binding protein
MDVGQKGNINIAGARVAGARIVNARSVALFTAAVIVLVAVPVFAGGSEDNTPYGGVVTIPLLNEVEGFHPLIDREMEGVVLQLLYNGLIKLDKNLMPVPDLAESWRISDDDLSWDFALRRGVLFHDGAEVTSADVVYTYEEILGGSDKYAVSPVFGNIASVSAVGEYTVRFTLRQPYAPLLQLLTVEILPSHLLEGQTDTLEQFRKAPSGTGPFKITAWGDDAVTLEAFDEYFEGRPFLDGVVLKRIPDKKRAWAELMQGNLSIVPDLDREDYEVIAQDDRFATYSYLDVFYHTILINNDDPFLADEDVRVALSKAIDIDELVRETLGGWADSTTGPFVPGTWPYDSSVTRPAFDPAAAKNVFEARGWKDTDGDSILDKDGKRLAVSMLIDQGDVLKEALAKNIKWQLLRIGVQLDVEILTPRELMESRLFPGNYQTALLQFNVAGDPDAPSFLFWHSSRIGATNLARYRNDEVDRLIEQGRSEYDLEKRKTIYHDIHRIMAEDVASIFLFVRRIYTGATSRIAGLATQPQLIFNSVREWKITAQ